MLQRRADKAWSDAGLQRLTPHECRHTFAFLMIAAGVNAKALSTFMGNAKIGITLDRYGHLMPGSEEEEAAGLLSDYLDAERARCGGPGSRRCRELDSAPRGDPRRPENGLSRQRFPH
jgi:hypothetical protein